MVASDDAGPHDELIVEERGAVRLLVLNRPDALNAANESLHGALANVWSRLNADADARARRDHGRGPGVLRRW